jgi:pantoate--beta-alanine ligase
MREPDGLAMSSRNVYLSVADRPRAVGLSKSLHQAAGLWSAGADTATIEQAMRETLSAHGVVVDYAALADPESLEPVPHDAARAVALVAGRLGSTRLIDNMELPARVTPQRDTKG